MARRVKEKLCVKGHPSDVNNCEFCAMLVRVPKMTGAELADLVQRQHGFLHAGLTMLHRECVKATIGRTASWYGVKAATAEVSQRRDALNALLEYNPRRTPVTEEKQ